MRQEFLYRIFFLCLIAVVPVVCFELGIRNEISTLLVTMLLTAFFQYKNPLNSLKSVYTITVRVFDPDGKRVENAKVRCSLGVEGKQSENGWLFAIEHTKIPYHLKTAFFACIPHSGLWANQDVYFTLKNTSTVDIHLRDEFNT